MFIIICFNHVAHPPRTGQIHPNPSRSRKKLSTEMLRKAGVQTGAPCVAGHHRKVTLTLHLIFSQWLWKSMMSYCKTNNMVDSLQSLLYLFSDVKLNWAWIAIWLKEGLASEVSSAEGAHDMIRCQVFAMLIFLNEFVWSALVIRSCRR